MPTSLAGNPLAFLRGDGGAVSQPGPTAAAPGGGGPDMGGGPGSPELDQMGMAGALAPHIMAQQQTDYYKRFLKQLAGLLRDFMRIRGIGPRAVGRIGAAVTNLNAAQNDLDKEKPEDSDPVQSLLAQGMMDKPAMSAAPMAGLPIQRF